MKPVELLIAPHLFQCWGLHTVHSLISACLYLTLVIALTFRGWIRCITTAQDMKSPGEGFSIHCNSALNSVHEFLTLSKKPLLLGKISLAAILIRILDSWPFIPLALIYCLTACSTQAVSQSVMNVERKAVSSTSASHVFQKRACKWNMDVIIILDWISFHEHSVDRD